MIQQVLCCDYCSPKGEWDCLRNSLYISSDQLFVFFQYPIPTFENKLEGKDKNQVTKKIVFRRKVLIHLKVSFGIHDWIPSIGLEWPGLWRIGLVFYKFT